MQLRIHAHLLFWSIACLAILMGCKDSASTPEEPILNPKPYFPPLSGAEWDKANIDSLNYNKAALTDLNAFLEAGGTRAFIILKDGKIAHEAYFGKEILGTKPFTVSSFWYWASAGKTLTSFLIGKAQEEKFLSIEESSQKYLGEGWSSLSKTQEGNITIKHHLTMTTGLDDSKDLDCTMPECLNFLAEPGKRWSYHNAPYTMLDQVISKATKMNFDDYFNSRLKNIIGMDGFWNYSGYNHIYYSTPRSMARFGLLMLNKGKWEDKTVMADSKFYTDMINTSQNLNLSYGYLWWLNGKASLMSPGTQVVFKSSLATNAPADAFCALGKNGQMLDVIPSLNMIVVRMGDNPSGASSVPIIYHNDLWIKINAFIGR